MIINCNDLDSKSTFHAEVCIIGAGAAGITLARALTSKGVSVSLLEAGGAENSDESQSIYQAESVTSGPVETDYDPAYPEWSRLRFFGGTTNHWGGWCRPFDEVDFKSRPWLEQSGWPFDRKVLESYYKEAAAIVDILPFDLKNEQEHPNQKINDLFKTSSFRDVESRYFQFSPPTRFAEKYFKELEESQTTKVYLNANVTQIITSNQGQEAKKLIVQKYNGQNLEFSAKYFVLCCGGIENPRMLLNFGLKDSGLFGNGYDNVGRYFMDHPHVDVGVLANYAGSDWVEPFKFNGLDPKRALVTSEKFQKIYQTLNFSCTIGINKKPPQDDESLRALYDKLNPSERIDTTSIKLFARTEMEPQRRNRISLSTVKDSLGLNKLNMDVTYSELDRRSFVESVTAVIRYLSFLNLGRGKYSFDPDLWPKSIGGGCHHLGTTRMSKNPKEGVVDGNSLIHGMKNMYVGGSSVFSTGGFANPTLTIVALSLRLADTIQKELKI